MIKGLPEKLKELRIKQGLSQNQVAQKLDISPSVVSGYETGERTPSVEVLLGLSTLYRCSTDYLLGKEKQAPAEVLEMDGLNAQQIRAIRALLESMRD